MANYEWLDDARGAWKGEILFDHSRRRHRGMTKLEAGSWGNSGGMMTTEEPIRMDSRNWAEERGFGQQISRPLQQPGIGTSAPQNWLDINGIGMFKKPNLWNRFWAWALFGWRWHESPGMQGWLVAKRK